MNSPTFFWLGCLCVLSVCLCLVGCDGSGQGPQPPAAKVRAKPAPVQLTESPPQKPLDVLLADLGNDDPAISTAAVESLARQAKADPQVVPALLEALHSEDHLQSSDAADALAKIGDPAMVPQLVEALREPASRQAAQGVLKRVATADSVAAFVPLLNDHDAFVRATAIDVLAARGGAGALDPLIDALGHKDDRTRRHIAAVLGDLGGKRAALALVQLLSDPAPIVTEEAARTLQRLSGKDFAFRPFDPPEDRAKAIQGWRAWAEGL